MTRPLRVLHIEDLEKFRKQVIMALEDSDIAFHYQFTDTLIGARQMVDQNFFHILVVDISLNQNDTHNDSGLEFVKEFFEANLLSVEHARYDSPMRAMMLSGFGNRKDWARRALREYNVMAFYDKSEDFKVVTFGDELAEMFYEEVSINLDLVINWQVDARDYIAHKMSTLSDTYKPQDEIEDLFCRLYATDADAITITATHATDADELLQFSVQCQQGDNITEEVVLCRVIKITDHMTPPRELAVEGRQAQVLRTTPHLRGRRFI